MIRRPGNSIYPTKPSAGGSPQVAALQHSALNPVAAHPLWRALAANGAFVQAWGKVSRYLQRRICPNDKMLLGNVVKRTDDLLRQGDFKPLGAVNAAPNQSGVPDTINVYLIKNIGFSGTGVKSLQKGILFFKAVPVQAEVKVNWLKKEIRTIGYGFEISILPPDSVENDPSTGKKDAEHGRSDPRVYILGVRLVVPVTEDGSQIEEAMRNPETFLREFFQTIPEQGSDPAMMQTAAFLTEVKAELFDRVGGLQTYQFERYF